MFTAPTTYRLVTRSDFDGLVCAMLLKELDLLDEIEFVHPKDMQDGKVAVTDRDITTNLPYVDGLRTSRFDHHASEALRNGGDPRQPRHRPRRQVGGAGRLRLLRRRREASRTSPTT